MHWHTLITPETLPFFATRLGTLVFVAGILSIGIMIFSLALGFDPVDQRFLKATVLSGIFAVLITGIFAGTYQQSQHYRLGAGMATVSSSTMEHSAFRRFAAINSTVLRNPLRDPSSLGLTARTVFRILLQSPPQHSKDWQLIAVAEGPQHWIYNSNPTSPLYTQLAPNCNNPYSTSCISPSPVDFRDAAHRAIQADADQLARDWTHWMLTHHTLADIWGGSSRLGVTSLPLTATQTQTLQTSLPRLRQEPIQFWANAEPDALYLLWQRKSGR